MADVPRLFLVPPIVAPQWECFGRETGRMTTPYGGQSFFR